MQRESATIKLGIDSQTKWDLVAGGMAVHQNFWFFEQTKGSSAGTTG